MHKSKKYLKILCKHENGIKFHDVAAKMMLNNPYADIKHRIIYNTAVCVIAPVLIVYIIWLLKCAQKNNIKKLYFLARDGYVMCEIAKIICKIVSIDIDCVYFYCSRMALRKPILYLNKEEALDMVFTNSLNVTLNIIFKRLDLSNKEKNKLVNLLKLDDDELDLSLNKREIEHYKNTIFENSECFNILYNKSQQAYLDTIGYFKNQGMLNNFTLYAIVDSGWTGSMQKCFRIIIENYYSKQIELKGFYFGITNKTKSENGKYFTYYFSSNSNKKRKLFFNNNVFECFCDANHGMTKGYVKKNGEYLPIIKKHFSNELIGIQIEAIINYTKLVSKTLCYKKVNPDEMNKLVFKILKSFMHKPSYDEAEVYGGITFCDDYSEDYMLPLAKKLSNEDIKCYTIFRLLKSKLQDIDLNSTNHLWIRGSIRKVRFPIVRYWLYLNNSIWNSLKIIYSSVMFKS